MRFIPHALQALRQATEANLGKTNPLMGEHAHDWCQRNNVSTGWMDIDPGTPMPEKAPYS